MLSEILFPYTTGACNFSTFLLLIFRNSIDD